MDYQKNQLELIWDEQVSAQGLNGVTVMPAASIGAASWSVDFREILLPLYLTATLHQCVGCGQCCRAFNLKYNQGIALIKQEAQTLQSICRITKRNGKYLLKFPCPLQTNNKCTQYERRPFNCRIFPITVDTGTNPSSSLAVFRACPTGKDTYVKSVLFLQALRHLATSAELIGYKITFDDLDQLNTKFEPNIVSPADMEYIKMKVSGIL